MKHTVVAVFDQVLLGGTRVTNASLHNFDEVVRKDIDRGKDPMPKGAKYDGAKMPFFMRVQGGVGMHEGFLPGYPASHGCIRMPGFMAEAFFQNVAVGTPVTIER